MRVRTGLDCRWTVVLDRLGRFSDISGAGFDELSEPAANIDGEAGTVADGVLRLGNLGFD